MGPRDNPSVIIPAQYQPPLPLDRLILEEGTEGAGDKMQLDVVIVGAGPAGLSCAIELAKLAKADGSELNVGVLEISKINAKRNWIMPLASTSWRGGFGNGCASRKASRASSSRKSTPQGCST